MGDSPTSVELFAGAGGMALGVHQAGFTHLLTNDFAPRAARSLEVNGRQRGDWHVVAGDVREIDWSDQTFKHCDVLAAGAPCQPFSIGGVHAGMDDDRNMFPEVFRAVRALRPKAVLVENVKGLTRAAFQPYLDYILDQLRLPHIEPLSHGSWRQHHARLRKLLKAHTSAPEDMYEVSLTPVHAADYGIPQKRQRIFMVAIRSDLGADWIFPTATHSKHVLGLEQENGVYWERVGLTGPPSNFKPFKWSHEIAAADIAAGLKPWLTLRETIHDLPTPVNGQPHAQWNDHIGIPGARIYKGHTPNPLDQPAKTIKAGVHGVPGGEHIVMLDSGEYRYLTVRECARVQTFPDDYHFEGPRSEQMRQIGNAVPVKLARIIGQKLNETLKLR